MKTNFLLFLVFTLLPFLAFCQDEFSNYEMSYFEKKNIYKIDISDKNNLLDRVFIDAASLDTSSKEGSIIIDAKKLDGFKEYLTYMKSKYIEWQNTAKTNSVKELDKEIEPEKRNTYSAAFSYGQWHFDFYVNLKARYKIIDGKHLLIISTGKLNSSSNQFIDSDGLAIVFSNETEIQNLINKLDLTKMEESFKNKNKKDDLFK